MAFWIYSKSVTDDNVRYERLKALRLGGPGGIIAQHVKRLPEVETSSWRLEACTLLTWVGFPARDEDYKVLFDAAPLSSASVCLYELLRIHGSCRNSSTQLALDFSILLDQEVRANAPDFARCFDLSRSHVRRLLSEVLTLTGGPTGGDWRWAAPAMQLGATIVGGTAYGRATGDETHGGPV
jgi:hypothetical protein